MQALTKDEDENRYSSTSFTSELSSWNGDRQFIQNNLNTSLDNIRKSRFYSRSSCSPICAALWNSSGSLYSKKLKRDYEPSLSDIKNNEYTNLINCNSKSYKDELKSLDTVNKLSANHFKSSSYLSDITNDINKSINDHSHSSHSWSYKNNRGDIINKRLYNTYFPYSKLSCSDIDENCSIRSEIIIRNIKDNYSRLISSTRENTPDLLSNSDISASESTNYYSCDSDSNYLDNTDNNLTNYNKIKDNKTRLCSGNSVNSLYATENISNSEINPQIKKEKSPSHTSCTKRQNSISTYKVSIPPDKYDEVKVFINNPSKNIIKKFNGDCSIDVEIKDSDVKPARPSAFNARQTIEKRQTEIKRRERKLLRRKVKEYLRSLSKKKKRNDSESSESSYTSAVSKGSQNLSLDLNGNEIPSDCSLGKSDIVTNNVRSYLPDGNLSDTLSIRSSDLVRRIMKPECFQSESLNCSISTNNFKVKDDNSSSYRKDFNEYNSLSYSQSNLNKSFENRLTHEEKANINRNQVNKYCNIVSPQDNIDLSSESPIPPPRRRSLYRRSAGQVKKEQEEIPDWIRVTKERRSLKAYRNSIHTSDTTSTEIEEADWIRKARIKLENMNVCVTNSVDSHSVSSHMTESSAWSRRGLDALQDLREEVNRISERISEEATEKVTKDLGIQNRFISSNMIEPSSSVLRTKALCHQTEHNLENSEKNYHINRHVPSKKEYTEYKNNTRDISSDKHKYSPISGIQTAESKLRGQNNKKKLNIPFNSNVTKGSSASSGLNKDNKTHIGNKSKNALESKNPHLNDKIQVLHFGDSPQDLITKSSGDLKTQSSSKFESIAGPDPLKMTAEQLNQNVEEYDFPIPNGIGNSPTELLNYLNANLNKQEIVPEIISNNESNPKPKSILKKKATELYDVNIDEIASKEYSKSPNLNEKSSEIEENRSSLQREKIISSPITRKLENSPSQQVHRIKSKLKEDNVIDVNEQFKHNYRMSSSDIPNSNKELHPSPKLGKNELISVKQNISDKLEIKEAGKIIEQIAHSNTKNKENFTSKHVSNDSYIYRSYEKQPKQIEKDFLEERNFHENYKNKIVDQGIDAPKNFNSLNRNKEKNTVSPHSVTVIKSFDESKMKDIYNYSPMEIKLQILDSPQRSLPKYSEKNKERLSLFEWEATQRRKIEDGEIPKNSKDLINKPMASKIKDLVKIHTEFMSSMFSRDRGGNGTVDAKGEILFQKIPNGNSSNINPMKSPVILQRLINFEAKKDSLLKEKELSNTRKNINKNTSHLRESNMYSSDRKMYLKSDNIHNSKYIMPSIITDNTSYVHSHKDKTKLNDKTFTQLQKPAFYFGQSTLENELEQNLNITYTDTKNHLTKKEIVNNVLNNLSKEHNEVIKSNMNIRLEDNLNTKSLNQKYLPKKIPNETSLITEIGSYKTKSVNKNVNQKLVYSIKDDMKEPLAPNQENIPSIAKHEIDDGFKTPCQSAEPHSRIPGYYSEYSSPYKSNGNVSSSLRYKKDSLRINNERIERENSSKSDSEASAIQRKENSIKHKENNADLRHIRRYKANYKSSNDMSNNKNNNTDTDEKETSFFSKNTFENIDKSRKSEGEKNFNSQSSNDSSLTKLVSNWDNSIKERSVSPCSTSDISVFGFTSDYRTSPYVIKRERTISQNSATSLNSLNERSSRPVSLSSILERDVTSPLRTLSPTEELLEVTKDYRNKTSNVDKKSQKRVFEYESSSTTNQDTTHIPNRYGINSKRKMIDYGNKTQKTDSRSRIIHKDNSKNSLSRNKEKMNDKVSTIEKGHHGNLYTTTASNHKSPQKTSTKLVRRKSSLKKESKPGNTSTNSSKRSAKKVMVQEPKQMKERKKLENKSGSDYYESIRHKDDVWTKKSVRRRRLDSDSSGKVSLKADTGGSTLERKFRSDASRDLQKWADQSKTRGKLVKKEGQKYSHQVEEEIQDGKKSTKAVSRRVVRRGSRKMSGGGELVSETKEISAKGSPDLNAKSDLKILSVVDKRPDRDIKTSKLKTTADGERYFTQSVMKIGGVKTLTSEGVDNKNIQSVEVIGGNDWLGQRTSKGRHGERVVVEQSVGLGGRPSTVVKKFTSQSKFIVTKTKKVPIQDK